MENFDDEYSASPNVFGAEAESSLVRFADRLEPSRTVLDVGCGQGRNSLFLARRGLSVDALDPSQVAIEQVERAAAADELPIRTILGTFQDLGTTGRDYSGILVFGLIPVLARPQIGELVRAVDIHLGRGGHLWITAFGTWDPDYRRRAAEWTEEDTNSFRSPDGRLRTYLEPGELVGLFPGLETIHSWEDLGPEHRHGDGPVERHGMAEAILRRG